MLYLCLLCAAGVIAVPLLPKSYTQRMDTIQGYQGDQSASTRLAVWAWTWDYVNHGHPFGGGFNAYLQNRIVVTTVSTQKDGAVSSMEANQTTDAARAYHSSYFEMLGEQGFPGLAIYLLLHALGLVRMEVVRRRWLKAAGEDAWIAPLATALQHGHLIYMAGSLFVGIAFQPFVYMLVGLEIGFDNYLRRRTAVAGFRADGDGGRAAADTHAARLKRNPSRLLPVSTACTPIRPNSPPA